MVNKPFLAFLSYINKQRGLLLIAFGNISRDLIITKTRSKRKAREFDEK